MRPHSPTGRSPQLRPDPGAPRSDLLPDGHGAFANADYTALGFQASVRDCIGMISEHEAEHVETLTAVIYDLDGEPVEEAEYDFGFTDLTSFLATAAAVENLGVNAYTGRRSVPDRGGRAPHRGPDDPRQRGPPRGLPEHPHRRVPVPECGGCAEHSCRSPRGCRSVHRQLVSLYHRPDHRLDHIRIPLCGGSRFPATRGNPASQVDSIVAPARWLFSVGRRLYASRSVMP